MRFAVIGDLGMFGIDMKSHLESVGIEVSGFNRSNLDLSATQDKLAKELQHFDVVVNAVAYTSVDQAELEPDLANLVNGEYAGKLARVAELIDAKFVHISTDYVFDGSSRIPISPNQILTPINAYGRSKALGEQLVSDSGADFTILRTAWLYGSHGRCFPRSIASKLMGGEPITVVNDQFGQPTWTKDLVRVVISHAINDHGEKIVHAVSSGKTSWFEFAQAVGNSLGLQDSQIQQTSSLEFPTPAKRPIYSVLDNTQTKGPLIGDWLQRWKEASREILKSI